MKTNSNTNKVIAGIASFVALLSCSSAQAASSDSQIADPTYVMAANCNKNLSTLLRRGTSASDKEKAAEQLQAIKDTFKKEAAQLAQSEGRLQHLSIEEAETVAVCLSNLRSL